MTRQSLDQLDVGVGNKARLHRVSQLRNIGEKYARCEPDKHVGPARRS